MRHFLFFLDLLLRRHETVQGETEFLGFEAFPRPTQQNEAVTTAPADKAGPGAASSSGSELLKAA